MVDRCVCCGGVIPEGTEVCINCRYQYLDQYSESGGTPSGSFADSSVSKTRGRDKHKMPPLIAEQKSFYFLPDSLRQR